MWYVAYLLLNKERADEDTESEFFSDFITLQNKIEDLKLLGALSEPEYKYISSVIDNGLLVDKSLFFNIVNRLSLCLGGVFTNEGYIIRLKENRSLTEEELLRLEKFMNERRNVWI